MKDGVYLMSKLYLSRFKDNAYIEKAGNSYTLYSYNIPIVKIDGSQLTELYPAYAQSVTTAKYRNLFFEEYAVRYGSILLSELSSTQLNKLLSNIFNGTQPKFKIENEFFYGSKINVPKETTKQYNLELTANTKTFIVVLCSKFDSEFEVTLCFKAKIIIPKDKTILPTALNLVDVFVSDLEISDVSVFNHKERLDKNDLTTNDAILIKSKLIEQLTKTIIEIE